MAINGTSASSALLMGPVKPPSEDSTVGHFWSLADQRRTKQVDEWCDERDMHFDLMTKGTVAGDFILDLMAGQFACTRDAMMCSREKRKTDVPSSKYSPLAKE